MPQGYREAGLALGIARWKIITVIVVRTALKGIITGILIATARVAGETAPLLFTALGNNFWSHRLSEPISALPLQIFTYAISPYDDWHRQAWAGALVLMALILTLNIVVRVLVPAIANSIDPLKLMADLSPAKPITMRPPGGGSPAAGRIPPSAAAGGREVAFDITGFSLWYGASQALFDVDIRIPARAVTAIIGPSGCGKSTFLRALNRMHELTPGTRIAGNLRLFGEDLYAAAIDPVVVRRRVGMVFQKSNPFPTMSVADNVLVGLRLNGVRDRAFLRDRLEASLRMAALWDEVKDHLDRPGISLSGGQQQRLCIARALAVQPEVLLMDEPCSALDPIATAKIEELINELRATYTLIIVTHNMQQAARVSNRTAFFYLGKLIEYDETRTIFMNPANPQTEAYVAGRFG